MVPGEGTGSSEQLRTCRSSFLAWLGQRDAATVDALIRRRSGPAPDGGQQRMPDAEAAANALRKVASAVGDRFSSPRETRHTGACSSTAGGGGSGGGGRAAAPTSSRQDRDWAEHSGQGNLAPSAHRQAAASAGYDDPGRRRAASRLSIDTTGGGGERGLQLAEAVGGHTQLWEAEMGTGDANAQEASLAEWSTPNGSGHLSSSNFGWAVGGLGDNRPASSHDKRHPNLGPERGRDDRYNEEQDIGAGVWCSSSNQIDVNRDTVGGGGGVDEGIADRGGRSNSGSKGGDEYGKGRRNGAGENAQRLQFTDSPTPSYASAAVRQHRPGGRANGGGNRGGTEYATLSSSGGANGGAGGPGGADDEERAELYSYLR